MKKRISSSILNIDIDLKGGEITSIKNKLNDVEYIWQGDENVWSKHAPILFPVVGKLKNFNYFYNDEKYVLMQHGFAKDLPFKEVSSKENEISLLLESSDITLQYYPFEFSLLAKYKVINSHIEVEYIVSNLNNKPMPFSIGVHPGFRCPLEDTLKYEDYELEFEKVEEFDRVILEGGIGKEERVKLCPASDTLQISKNLFSEDAIVLENPKSTQITLSTPMDNKKVTINFSKVPYLGLWSKPLEKSYICIEPWLGMSDFENSTGKLEEKEAIQILKPYQIFEFKFSIDIE